MAVYTRENTLINTAALVIRDHSFIQNIPAPSFSSGLFSVYISAGFYSSLGDFLLPSMLSSIFFTLIFGRGIKRSNERRKEKGCANRVPVAQLMLSYRTRAAKDPAGNLSGRRAGFTRGFPIFFCHPILFFFLVFRIVFIFASQPFLKDTALYRLCDPADAHVYVGNLVPCRIIHYAGLGYVKNSLKRRM